MLDVVINDWQHPWIDRISSQRHEEHHRYFLIGTPKWWNEFKNFYFGLLLAELKAILGSMRDFGFYSTQTWVGPYSARLMKFHKT